MSNTAKAITSDTFYGEKLRRITGTLGADGVLTVAEGIANAKRISIQLLGTPNSSVQTVLVSNGSSSGTFVGLPTAVAFSNTTGYKTVAFNDLGFNAMQFSGASAGGSSDLSFIILIQETD